MTLQLNSDGAKYFKVSRFGILIFMAIINEAKYGVRRKYVILLSIWVGNKKPPRDAFMNGSIGELRRIEQEGFKALVPEYLYSCCHGSFKLYIELFTSTVAGNGKKGEKKNGEK